MLSKYVSSNIGIFQNLELSVNSFFLFSFRIDTRNCIHYGALVCAHVFRLHCRSNHYDGSDPTTKLEHGPGPGSPMSNGYSSDHHAHGHGHGRMTMHDTHAGHSPDRYSRPHPHPRDQRNNNGGGGGGAMHSYMGAQGPNRGDHMRTTRSAAARARMQQQQQQFHSGAGGPPDVGGPRPGAGGHSMSPVVGSSTPPAPFGLDGGHMSAGSPSRAGPGAMNDFDHSKNEMMRRDAAAGMGSQALADGNPGSQGMFPQPRRGSLPAPNARNAAPVQGTVISSPTNVPANVNGGGNGNFGANANNGGSGPPRPQPNTSGGGGSSRRNGQCAFPHQYFVYHHHRLACSRNRSDFAIDAMKDIALFKYLRHSTRSKQGQNIKSEKGLSENDDMTTSLRSRIS